MPSTQQLFGTFDDAGGLTALVQNRQDGAAFPVMSVAGVFIVPTGTILDTLNAQAAANAAMAAGVSLNFGPGRFNFTNGGIVCDTGPDLVRAGQVSNGYRALKILGAGSGKTIIDLGANRRGFFFANDGTKGSGVKPEVSAISIIGTGIAAGAIAVQVGGRSAVRSDLLLQFTSDDLLIDNVQTGFIFDDVTGIDITNLALLRYKYGFEWGYNVDDVRVTMLGTSDQGFTLGIACTITNGSNVITGIPASTIAALQVGYAISAPGRFPLDAYVGSIGVSSITVVNYNNVAVNASAAGTSCSFMSGRTFNFGIATACAAGVLYPERGSPFVSPYWSTVYGLQGRISASKHDYYGLINQAQLAMEVPGNSHFLIRNHCYTEQCCALMLIGEAASTTQAQRVGFVDAYLGQPQTFVQAPMTVLCAQQGYTIDIIRCHTDGAGIGYPWFNDPNPNYGRAGLVWEDNSGMFSTLGYNVQIGEANVNACRVQVSGAFYGNSARKGDGFEVKNGGNWRYHGQDGMNIDLAAANVTLPNPLTYSLDQSGKTFTVFVTGFTGRTLTFGSYFLKSDGTALGAVASGATGTFMQLVFTWNSTENKFRALNAAVFS